MLGERDAEFASIGPCSRYTTSIRCQRSRSRLLAGQPLYFLLVPRLLDAKDPEMLSFILFFGFSQVIVR